ncbi:Pyridoxal phosphate-dependent transferase domain 1-containing protein [Dioscorea alata]|uniref:Pyridoxal phosphate-dependent transferase domain 1-containing protein n=1 Tax=Dioscorea alata TaxID=55571 RepID=A0ACB7UHI5_DIOAL|nr:Pyridoxal phosphate-dependent transferase domain 1-containing protein [Dioscorea alata]
MDNLNELSAGAKPADQNPNPNAAAVAGDGDPAQAVARPTRTPFTNLSQVDGDLALACTLQEQVATYLMLLTGRGISADYANVESSRRIFGTVRTLLILKSLMTLNDLQRLYIKLWIAMSWEIGEMRNGWKWRDFVGLGVEFDERTFQECLQELPNPDKNLELSLFNFRSLLKFLFFFVGLDFELDGELLCENEKGRKKMILFSGNDYLGLSAHSTLRIAALEAARMHAIRIITCRLKLFWQS